METDRSYLMEKAGRLFEFDPRIRSVVMLTSEGKPVVKVIRPGFKQLEPEAESETVYVKASIAISMSSPMNKYFGRLRTVILTREKVVIVCFNLAARIMLIIAEPDFQVGRVEELGQLVDQLNIS